MSILQIYSPDSLRYPAGQHRATGNSECWLKTCWRERIQSEFLKTLKG